MRLCLKPELAFSPIAYAVVVAIGENQIDGGEIIKNLLSQKMTPFESCAHFMFRFI